MNAPNRNLTTLRQWHLFLAVASDEGHPQRVVRDQVCPKDRIELAATSRRDRPVEVARADLVPKERRGNKACLASRRLLGLRDREASDDYEDQRRGQGERDR